MAAVIAQLEAEIVALDQAIEDAIGQNEDLRTRHDLLVSVPGIATHTAAVILSEMPGCCARRGKRRLMPVSIRAIGSPARRSMRRRGSPGSATPPCVRPSTSGPRRAPLEPAGGRPAPAPEGPGAAQAQADRRSRDAQAAAPVLWRAQDRQTVRSQPCLGDRQNGCDDLSDPRLQKQPSSRCSMVSRSSRRPDLPAGTRAGEVKEGRRQRGAFQASSS